MPWGAKDTVSLREEFVQLALCCEFNFSELCRRFVVSRKTGYKWLARFKAEQQVGLNDRARRPLSSPLKTDPDMEERVVELRKRYPARGGRKLRRMLQNSGLKDVPATSTITGILHRHQLIDPAESIKHVPCQRFERTAPNEMWQMDFKGHVPMDRGRCHPLTILDDHSRFAVGLFACDNERTQTVQEHLTTAFRTYGLPQSILTDNGSPWGTAGAEEKYTTLTVWLMQMGVRVLHGRPRHPQTQGKDERFHRTLATEVLVQHIVDLLEGQNRFNNWRHDYNWVRPHEALQLDLPGKRYTPSQRSFKEQLPSPEYDSSLDVRKVDKSGSISIWGISWKIGKAFVGKAVGIEPTPEDGIYKVFFYGQVIKKLDRTSAQ
jgi:transposase InsO family protein